ncbi:hypothetical protein [Mycetocola saprophilus]|uniref:hypothetical protein n=1 Tax=Mycetocola saprophilus TaxID=76636 RepID=UPI003BEFE6BB
MKIVWESFGAPKSNGLSAYLYARNGWELTPTKYRNTDRTPPPGAVVYFLNTARPSAPGHIAISVGGGYIASTDKPRDGQTGRVSISDIEKSWGGRTYLGWSYFFLGHTITPDGKTPTPTRPAPPVTPPIPKDDTMSKILSVPGGTIALVGEFSSRVYTRPDGTQGYSQGLNKIIGGEIPNLTEDQLATAVNEVTGRRAALIDEITAKVTAAVLAALDARKA